MSHSSLGDSNAHYSVQGETSAGSKVKGNHAQEDESKQTVISTPPLQVGIKMQLTLLYSELIKYLLCTIKLFARALKKHAWERGALLATSCVLRGDRSRSIQLLSFSGHVYTKMVLILIDILRISPQSNKANHHYIWVTLLFSLEGGLWLVGWTIYGILKGGCGVYSGKCANESCNLGNLIRCDSMIFRNAPIKLGLYSFCQVRGNWYVCNRLAPVLV